MALNNTITEQALQQAAENIDKNTTGLTDPNKRYDVYKTEMRAALHKIIPTITITIPSGSIITTGTAASQSNPNPIVIQNTPLLPETIK